MKECISRINISDRPMFSDITPYSVLDYKGNISLILWYPKCNLKCRYCFNPEMVNGEAKYTLSHVLKLISRRKGIYDSVVLSGGESTLNPLISEVCAILRLTGLKIKIDTNGTHPEVLKSLISNNLVDFVALDVKAHEVHLYNKVTKSLGFSKVKESMKLLINSDIDYEFRTTVHSDFFSETKIVNLIKFTESLGYNKAMGIQKAQKDIKTLGHLKNTKDFDINKISSKVAIEPDYRGFW